jgi:osomolarity two-component system phosphorelay intermediate protein YPD1
MPAADPPAPANAATTPAAPTVAADKVSFPKKFSPSPPSPAERGWCRPDSWYMKPTEDLANFIDLATFEQIREMDEDDNDDFSRMIVSGFLEQAKDTFEKMDKSLSALSQPQHA